ncbi:hypothetical protein ACNE9Y_32015 [Pseudomonas sp. NY11226]|uniref:hypothetical protein n=1 Tax=unclassified Pseudomonas TaxID=196821 RepID=UPI0006D47240|nr:hypothetical protein [Pseudomonas sp. NBRC 111118]
MNAHNEKFLEDDDVEFFERLAAEELESGTIAVLSDAYDYDHDYDYPEGESDIEFDTEAAYNLLLEYNKSKELEALEDYIWLDDLIDKIERP